jgi:D-3-phosphoglycerate dehydrogenase
LGAATEEAQENVALDVAHQIVNFLVNGTIENALNVPSVSGEVMAILQPYILLCEKIGKLHGQLAEESPSEVRVEFSGDITKLPTSPLTLAAVKGILEPILEDVTVNLVNAPSIAKERGIRVTESKASDNKDFANLITVSLLFKSGQRVIAGTIFGKTHPRLVRFEDYYLEVIPEGKIFIIKNEDKPGVVGAIGTLLAKNNLNISRLQLGLNNHSKLAAAFYHVEGNITPHVLEEIKKVPGIVSVQKVEL